MPAITVSGAMSGEPTGQNGRSVCSLQSALYGVVALVLASLVCTGMYISGWTRPDKDFRFTDLTICNQGLWPTAPDVPEFFDTNADETGAGLLSRMDDPSQKPARYTKPLDKQHFVITGGAGYIGSHAALLLLELGHRVTIIDNLSRGHLEAVLALEEEQQAKGQLAFYDVDLGDARMVTQLFMQLARTSQVDVVIHFAAVAYVGESIADPLLYYANVTSNTANLLRAMQRSNVSNFIYSSSCATYGNAERMPITEETPQQPTSPYGQSKLLAEQIVIDHAKAQGMSAVILRYFNVIGSDPKGRVGESPRSAVAKRFGRISGACFAAALGHRESLTIMGTDFDTIDGTCVRDYIHVVDLVKAHVQAMVAILRGGIHIYNVGLGNGFTVRQFINACKNVTGADIKVIEGPRREGDPAKVYADASKVKTELKWQPRFTNLDESLRTAWRWSKQAKY